MRFSINELSMFLQEENFLFIVGVISVAYEWSNDLTSRVRMLSLQFVKDVLDVAGAASVKLETNDYQM